MTWKDIVKAPPLTPEEEKLIQEEMRFGNVDRKEAERRIRRRTGKTRKGRTVSHDEYMRFGKGEEEYSFYLKQIEKIENMLERLYDDIEKSAIEMNKQTGVPLEQAREIIKNIQKDTINAIEKALEEVKQKLKRTF